MDHDGNAYLTGITWSADFPGAGGTPPGDVAMGAPFVLKLGPDNQIVYSAYFGAPNATDIPRSIAVDAQGQAVVSGQTWGTIAEVFAAHPGMCAADPDVTGFLAILAADGASFRFSTCLPAESGHGVAVDPVGAVTVVGWGAGDAFIGRYLSSGQSAFTLAYGGSSGDAASDVAVDARGHTFVVGTTRSSNLSGTTDGLQPTLPSPLYQSGFVAEFTPTGALVRATYLGGTGGRSAPNGVAVDRFGDVSVTGWTLAADFPVAAATRTTLRESPWGPIQTAFVTKLRPNLRDLAYSTFYAQENIPVDGTVEYVDSEEGRKLAVDPNGNTYVIGYAFTFNDATYFTGAFSWVAAFDRAGQPKSNLLLDLTPNGDEAFGIAVVDSGELYIVGHVDYLWACVWVDGVGQVCSVVSDADAFVLRIPGLPGEKIVILPTTTRWKAQKDVTTPIVVNFKAPKGYTPVSLDITDPSGGLLANQSVTISGPIDPNAGPGQYAITWNGPWSWTDASTGQIGYHTVGNYTVKIRGTNADGTALESDPSKLCDGAAAGTPACSIVSLVEVTAIKFMDKPGTRGRVRNSDLGGPGGGWAVFPEATSPSPNDQVGDEDKVEVVATVSPAVPDVRGQEPLIVYFRGVDVDDPSTGIDPLTGLSSPVDDETLPQDNCLGGGCAVPPAGSLNGQNADAPVPVTLAPGGVEAKVDFQVSNRQGDNYRVAASTSPTWLSGPSGGGLTAAQNNTFGEVGHSTGEPVLDPDAAKGPQVSEMLTVWRTLHLEVQQMYALGATQIDLDKTGTWTALQPQYIKDRIAGFSNLDHPNDLFLNPRGDWRGATLSVGPFVSNVHFSLVTSNTLDRVNVDPSVDLTQLPQDPQQRYVLRDDELSALSASTSVLGDLQVSAVVLAGAYVDLQPIVVPQKMLFHRNLSDPLQQAFSGIVQNTATYWNLPLLLSYEAETKADYDPTAEPAVFGRTTAPFAGARESTRPHTALFYETLRDFDRTSGLPNMVSDADHRALTLAHEIMHAFRLIHDGTSKDGSLMCYSALIDRREQLHDRITSRQLATARQTVIPSVRNGRYVQHTCR